MENNDRRQVNFKLDQEVFSRLKAMAAENCRSMAKQIEYLVKQAHKDSQNNG